MNKKPWNITLRKSAIVLLLVLSIASVLMPALPVTASSVDLLWGPYLTEVTPTGIVINCRTSELSEATVEFASGDDYSATGSYNRSAADGVTSVLHHISLTGLLADTTYHYRMVCNDIATPDYHFTTLPSSGPFSFIIIGDTQYSEFSEYSLERCQIVADSIAAENDIAFVIHCGDHVDSGNDLSSWNKYFEIGHQLITGVPFYDVMGNHERDSQLYYDAFGNSSYYSFDCSTVHFSILNSNEDDLTPQVEWLETDLNSGKQWKFVVCHYPAYTSDASHYGGYNNVKAAWENLFIEKGVQVVFNGHIHAYERYLENGVNYVGQGTAGAPLYSLSETKCPGYQNSLEHSLGYTRVTVDTGTGTITVDFIRVADMSPNSSQFLTIYPADTVYDSFVLTGTPSVKPDWDLNNDHKCNIGDVVKIGLQWGLTGAAGWISEDLNKDGKINIGDVVVVGLHWGQTW